MCSLVEEADWGGGGILSCYREEYGFFYPSPPNGTMRLLGQFFLARLFRARLSKIATQI